MTTVGMGTIARNQALGQLLTQQGLSPQPVSHPLQGLSQLAQVAMGSFLANKAERQERERREAGQEALLQLLGGGQVASAGMAPGMAPAPADMTPGMVPTPAGPDLSALMQFAGQFPELAGAVNPLIAQRLTPQKGVALSPGQQLRHPVTGALMAQAPAKPEKFQTDFGKAMADARLAEGTFGKDSPQAAAFREMAQQERAGGGVDLSDEAGQRKEFTKASGDFVKVRDAFGKIQKAKGTAAGDLALIFNYMKLLDPGSVVREGEFATAQNTAGVPDRVRNTYNRMLSGERLNPTQRQNFKNQAADVFIAQRDQQDLLEDEFSRIASASGLRPQNVIVDFQGSLRGFEVPGSAGQEQAPMPTIAPDVSPNIGSAAEMPAAPTDFESMAVHPETGEVRVLRNGEWVPL